MSDKTKQVQFRMNEELHTELRKALIEAHSSMTEFFNQAASLYLKQRDEIKNAR